MLLKKNVGLFACANYMVAFSHLSKDYLNFTFSLVHFLLDEIVGSTVHRCVDPVTMETSVSFETILESSSKQ